MKILNKSAHIMFQFVNLQPQESFPIDSHYSPGGKPVHPKALDPVPCQELIDGQNQESLNIYPLTTCQQLTNVVPTIVQENVDYQKKDEASPKQRSKTKGEVDTSSFTIEERLVSAVWVHERARSRLSIGQIKRNFKQRFDKEPPTKNTLLIWEKKLFATGNVMDAKRSGRPCLRKEHLQAVQASVSQAPGLSLRARAAALALPRTTLRKIICDDLRVSRQAKKRVSSEAAATVRRKTETVRPPNKPKDPPKPRVNRQPGQPQMNHQQQPEPIHHNPQQNPINYHGYGDIVVPMHLPEYHPYMGYQNPGDNKHLHQTNMGQMGHQHYVVGPVHNHML